MSILITTNEPKRIRNLFTDRIELPMNYDFLLYTEHGTVGIERKSVPGDLLSSVADGRLNREIMAMREECDFQVVLLHGYFRFRKDGTVRMPGRPWTKVGLRNLLRTIQYVEGCFLEQASSNSELVSIVDEMQDYFDKDKHLSLKGRLPIQTDWVVPSNIDKVRYFYDGIPGVGVIGAENLRKVFPTPLSLFNATVDDICKVKGFGKASAVEICRFLRGSSE